MPIVAAFFVGALFAVGLGLSGMTQPEKVIGFLDFAGDWDPTLMFVMGGATTFYFVFYRVVRGHAPVLTEHFQLPSARHIDWRLVTGAGMFGVGWGIAGFCPGPALTSLGNGMREPVVFVAAMLGGMVLYRVYQGIEVRIRESGARGASATGSSG